MLKYKQGNLMEASTEALVNTVNTVGVMGKGIALQFKERYKHNFKVYSEACKNGSIGIGKLLVVKENTIEGEKLIVNFPTKTEWYKKSQYNYIEEGLKDLVRVIETYQIKSIAMPPLGCGNGGLDWTKVKQMIEKYLGGTATEVIVYEPNATVKQLLQKETENAEVKLTPARAMLLDALFTYVARGEDASVFAANKLAYFLQRSGEKMKLNFVPHTYGPYDQRVEKVLYALNGKYVRGLEQMTAKAFEPLILNEERKSEVKAYIEKELSVEQKKRLQDLYKLIEGFESSLSLEILASVDFLKQQNKFITEDELVDKIAEWNERKKNLIKKEYIDIASKHLENYANQLPFA